MTAFWRSQNVKPIWPSFDWSDLTTCWLASDLLWAYIECLLTQSERKTFLSAFWPSYLRPPVDLLLSGIWLSDRTACWPFLTVKTWPCEDCFLTHLWSVRNRGFLTPFWLYTKNLKILKNLIFGPHLLHYLAPRSHFISHIPCGGSSNLRKPTHLAPVTERDSSRRFPS